MSNTAVTKYRVDNYGTECTNISTRMLCTAPVIPQCPWTGKLMYTLRTWSTRCSGDYHWQQTANVKNCQTRIHFKPRQWTTRTTIANRDSQFLFELNHTSLASQRPPGGTFVAFRWCDAALWVHTATAPAVFWCLFNAEMIDQQTAAHAARIHAQSGLGMWPFWVTGLSFIALCAPTARMTYSIIIAEYTADLHKTKMYKLKLNCSDRFNCTCTVSRMAGAGKWRLGGGNCHALNQPSTCSDRLISIKHALKSCRRHWTSELKVSQSSWLQWAQNECNVRRWKSRERLEYRTAQNHTTTWGGQNTWISNPGALQIIKGPLSRIEGHILLVCTSWNVIYTLPSAVSTQQNRQ